MNGEGIGGTFSIIAVKVGLNVIESVYGAGSCAVYT
jgi:hypothetical protein